LAIGVDLPDVHALPWAHFRAPEGLDKVPIVAELGAGEREVLALGMQVPGAVVILDERLGRLYAESPKLSFTGRRFSVSLANSTALTPATA
jgi:hypothetical protein